MAVVRVPLALRRLVRATEAEVVGRDAARDARERRDHLAVEKRPRRLAVQEQHGIAFAFVEVVHAQAVLLDVVRFEGEVRQVREVLVRCAVDAHHNRSSSAFFFSSNSESVSTPASRNSPSFLS